MASVKEETIETKDGCSLYVKTFTPKDKKPIGTVTFIHGLGEHCSRYDTIFERFAQSGLVVNAFDQRGHGKSSGSRGYIKNYDVNFGDITTIASKADRSLPHIVYGHSMGGGLSLGWSAEQNIIPNGIPIAGVVSTSPMLRMTNPKNLTVSVAKFMSNIIPSLTADNGLNVKHLSRDESEVEKYKNDPLVHPKISLSLLRCMFDMGQKNLDEAENFTYPLLIVHGGKDEITDPKSSEEFFNKASSKDKTLKIYPELFHECHNELPEDREIVIKTILDWIVDHCEKWTPPSSVSVESIEDAKEETKEEQE